MQVEINEFLVNRLIKAQFPYWQELPIQQVLPGGWDNRTFRLGEKMLVRMPSAAEYALKVEKEQEWLPKLKPYLPQPIPVPLAMGKPDCGYPWRWSIYEWLEGETASINSITNLEQFAIDLATFIKALHCIDNKQGLLPGIHNFYRGGDLKIYDAQTQQAILVLQDKIDGNRVKRIWQTALSSNWQADPVWVHGDISLGNLVVQKGKLAGVIDFGGMAIGDPACDLVTSWTLFYGESRKIFCETLALDAKTWERAKGWALWKALIVAAQMTTSIDVENMNCWKTLAMLMDNQ
jgi:aminoglycoside phosphotransferase (APT) family kinase protein